MPTLHARLAASPRATTLWAMLASICVYTCMYAFRKPFAAGTFEGDAGFLALQWKSVLIISQVLGYCVSKFVGIKIVSEIEPRRRGHAIVGTIALSGVGLVWFAVLPRPWSAIGLFLNGLPLGMVWGLVFGVLEGRKTSDLLGAALCGCFIVSSGLVKGVGSWLLGLGVPEVWMPAATAALFFPPLVGFTWMLAQTPPPTGADEAARTRRRPMDAAARRAFLATYGPGIGALTVGYVVITAYRDFRDNFAAELWGALGWADAPAVLAVAEIPIAVGSLAAVAAIYSVSSNEAATRAIHAMLVSGALLVGAATAAHGAGLIGPGAWMILVGLGLYVAYVPFNCVLFDRLLASLGVAGTAAFLITFSDAFGYLGSVAVLLVKDLVGLDLSWVEFFTGFSYVASAIGAVSWSASAAFFGRHQPSLEVRWR